MFADKIPSQRKVMLFGLDGLTLHILWPLVKAGQLPTFARLLKEGAYGILHSVTNMTTGPTWTSFATGCNPQRHGVLHDFHHHSGSYTLQPTTGRDCNMPTIWQIASEAGRTVIVLNVPLTYPAKPLRGILLAGIDAPSENARGFDYPAGSYRDLRRHGHDYLIDCGLASYMQTGQISAGIAAVERETEGRTRAAEYFMQQLNWQLLVVVYSLPDVWQHYYWTAPENSREREIMYDGYRLLDRHLARLLAYLPEDGRVIVCSDHGFGPLHGTRDHLNVWLAQQGLLYYQQGKSKTLLSRLRAALLAQIRQRVSFRRRQQLLASVPGLRRLVETRLRMGGIDWQRTKVYAALDHLELWLNLQGRQPYGPVDPAEYDALCAELTAALLAWRDEEGGPPYIKAVHRQPYQNDHQFDYLPPDLALEWNPMVTPPRLHPLISGDHDSEGTLIVAGEGVRASSLAACSLIDVAPLALQALGLPVPEGIQGKAPAHLFN